MPSTATILFGAFDRHNFGDMLFPHVVSSLLPEQPLYFVGLAEQDMQHYGGHVVRALPDLSAEMGERPVRVIHVGGEILTCNAWQAAVMLSPPEWVDDIVRSMDGDEGRQFAWAREELGNADLIPYVAPRTAFFHTACLLHAGIGGIELNNLPEVQRTEVLDKLRQADAIGVRDNLTLAMLTAAGIKARLIPDTAVMVAELFGERISRSASEFEVANIIDTFPRGYIAMQFSADFGDDMTLTEIAAQLDAAANASGYGIALFRAGAAPWHDDLACYRRLRERMQTKSVAIFESLDIWEICALIAHAKVYCGSSLHGRIVASAFALPRVGIVYPLPDSQIAKQTAYANTWETPDLPATVTVTDIAEGVLRSLKADPGLLRHSAQELADRYRQAFRMLFADCRP